MFFFCKFWFYGLLMGKNGPKWQKSMSQEPYMIWSWFMVHICKRIISPGVSYIFFQILVFGVNSGTKEQKNGLKWQNGLSYSVLKNYTSYDSGFWFTCVKWWYLRQVFPFFLNSYFLGFSKFINKCQKKILRCVPPASHVCNFLLFISVLKLI